MTREMIYDLKWHIDATLVRVGCFVLFLFHWLLSKWDYLGKWGLELDAWLRCVWAAPAAVLNTWTGLTGNAGVPCQAAALNRTQTQREINCRSRLYWTGSMLFSSVPKVLFRKHLCQSFADLAWCFFTRRSWLTWLNFTLYPRWWWCRNHLNLVQMKSEIVQGWKIFFFQNPMPGHL